MFIAMNRFKVLPGCQADFERVWTARVTYLHDVPGFAAFHLLRGPERDDHTLYSSHTLGAAGRISRPGRGRRRFASPTGTPAATGRSISAILNSRASR